MGEGIVRGKDAIPSFQIFWLYAPDDAGDTGCRLRYIHKPDFQRYIGTYWGAWFRDARPLDRETTSSTWSEKLWVSLHYRGSTLLEYANYHDFRQELSPHCRSPF